MSHAELQSHKRACTSRADKHTAEHIPAGPEHSLSRLGSVLRARHNISEQANDVSRNLRRPCYSPKRRDASMRHDGPSTSTDVPNNDASGGRWQPAAAFPARRRRTARHVSDKISGHAGPQVDADSVRTHDGHVSGPMGWSPLSRPNWGQPRLTLFLSTRLTRRRRNAQSTWQCTRHEPTFMCLSETTLTHDGVSFHIHWKSSVRSRYETAVLPFGGSHSASNGFSRQVRLAAFSLLYLLDQSAMRAYTDNDQCMPRPKSGIRLARPHCHSGHQHRASLSEVRSVATHGVPAISASLSRIHAAGSAEWMLRRLVCSLHACCIPGPRPWPIPGEM